MKNLLFLLLFFPILSFSQSTDLEKQIECDLITIYENMDDRNSYKDIPVDVKVSIFNRNDTVFYEFKNITHNRTSIVGLCEFKEMIGEVETTLYVYYAKTPFDNNCGTTIFSALAIKYELRAIGLMYGNQLIIYHIKRK